MYKNYFSPKHIVLFIILLAIVFLTSQMIIGVLFESKVSEKNNARIEIINQKVDIITSISNSDTPELRTIGQEYVKDYDTKSKELCRQQYFFKSNCTLQELNKNNLDTLNADLEEAIQEIVTVQNEVLK